MRSFLIVGLGNPGKKFESTRHNLGYMVLRAWYAARSADGTYSRDWQQDKYCQAEIAQVNVTADKIIYCLLPLTGMNLSGEAVKNFLSRKEIPAERILIVHDDIESAFGEVKFKINGSAAGHNGIRSIHQALATDNVPRLRIGVGRPTAEQDVSRFVLEEFSQEEQAALPKIISRAVDLITEHLSRV